MTKTVILSTGYTKEDLYLAAVQVQAGSYSLTESEQGKNTNNARLFESPAVKHLPDGRVEIETAEHSDDRVEAFNTLVNRTDAIPAWQTLIEQYPFQFTAHPTTPLLDREKTQANKQQLALYWVKLIELFKNIWLEKINQTLLAENITDRPAQLILSLAVSMKSMLTPKGTINDPAFLGIYTLLSMLENRIPDVNFMDPQPGNDIESCCDAMLRLISLTMTQPIGNEMPYGGMLGRSRGRYAPELGEYTGPEYQDFFYPSHYLLPTACFSLQETENHNDVLWCFLSLNRSFLSQIHPEECPAELARITVQRLWDAFTQDARCPAWIKQEHTMLNEKILTLPISALALLDNLEKEISECDHSNENSLETIMTTATNKLHLLIRKNPQEGPAETSKNIASLWMIYKEHKSLHGKCCATILKQINASLTSQPKDSKNPVTVLLESCTNLLDSDKLNREENQALLADISKLKGAIPDNLRIPFEQRSQQPKKISPTRFLRFWDEKPPPSSPVSVTYTM